VHTQVDVASKQRPLNLFREHASRANLLDRASWLGIAARGNFNKLNLVPQPPQRTRNPLGLPARKLTASRTKSQHATLL
jgi:hypothetical protein